MNGNSSVAGVAEVLFDNFEEVVDNVVGRVGAIHKEKVVVLDVICQERLFVVLLLVETDDSVHSDILEDVAVLLGMVPVPVASVSLLNGTHESYELAWDDPVKVSVLNFLVVLVLLDIECLEVVPAKLECILEALEDVKQRAVVEAVSLGSISVMFEQTVVGLELFESLVCSHLQYYYHKCAH
jgi:hypothetical protein